MLDNSILSGTIMVMKLNDYYYESELHYLKE